MQLCLVSTFLSPNGWKEEVYIREAIETANGKSFYIERDGNKTRIRVLKGNLLVPNTKLREDMYDFFWYYTYCYFEDVDQAKKILREKIIDNALKVIETVEQIKQILQS